MAEKDSYIERLKQAAEAQSGEDKAMFVLAVNSLRVELKLFKQFCHSLLTKQQELSSQID